MSGAAQRPPRFFFKTIEFKAVIEREIKLSFASVDEARAALVAAGAEPLAARRLQDDRLYDTADQMLYQQRSMLRLRREGEITIMTFKGPVTAGVVKTREEIETRIDDADAIEVMLARLGFAPWFRYQKYREEFRAGGAVCAIDETPAGVYVEIEGDESSIVALASTLGRGAHDFILDSYLGLWTRARGADAGDMLF